MVPSGLPRPMVYTRIPRSIASCTTDSGGGNTLFSPSVSRTMVAGAKYPSGTGVARGFAGTGVVRWPGAGWTGAAGKSRSLFSKMASSEVRMPRPIAVPRCGRRREIAAFTASLSSVGAWTIAALSENETTPMRAAGLCLSTKVIAAAFAASIRFGLTSSACMLPETSMARITVPSSLGSVTTDCGRASPMSMAVSASRNSTAGMCRRRPGPLPRASRTSVRLA